VRVCDKEIRVSGGLVRIARLDADMYHFLTDPLAMIAALHECRTRVDLFTFTQTIVDTKPKYSYPMEWENLAVLPVSTFEEWWDKQIGFKARNKAKQAEKKGVVLREVPFGEDLVRGIWEIYNETPVRQRRPYPHFGTRMEAVYRESATYLQYSTFIGAYAGEELIGFIRIVADEAGGQAGVVDILLKICPRHEAPPHAPAGPLAPAAPHRSLSHPVYSHLSYAE